MCFFFSEIGVPLVIIHFTKIFHEINPYFGYLMTMETNGFGSTIEVYSILRAFAKSGELARLGRESRARLLETISIRHVFLVVNHGYLVGGLEHVLFFHLLGIIIPTDSYFSEGLKPPTSYKHISYSVN